MPGTSMPHNAHCGSSHDRRHADDEKMIRKWGGTSVKGSVRPKIDSQRGPACPIFVLQSGSGVRVQDQQTEVTVRRSPAYP
jgi:hypothetical protein